MQLRAPAGMRLASAAWAFALVAAPGAACQPAAAADSAQQFCCCPPAVAQACCPEQTPQPCCSFSIPGPAGPITCECVLLPLAGSSDQAVSAAEHSVSAAAPAATSHGLQAPPPCWHEPCIAAPLLPYTEHEYYSMLASTVLRI